MPSIFYPFCSFLVIILLVVITQASLLDNSQTDLTLSEIIRMENDIKNGAAILQEILEQTHNIQPEDFDRLPVVYRAKRCRWKLCGTGRRFRYL